MNLKEILYYVYAILSTFVCQLALTTVFNLFQDAKYKSGMNQNEDAVLSIVKLNGIRPILTNRF